MLFPPEWRMKWVRKVLALVCGSLVMTSPALAQDMPTDRALAESLHQKALTAYDARNFQEAARHWLAAEAAAPSWRYTLNLAKTYYALGDNARCWDWAQRTRARPMTEAVASDEEHLAAVMRTCEADLLKTHARMEITCDKDDACAELVVQRGTARVQLPYVRWVRPTTVAVQVRWNGQVVHQESISAGAGQVVTRRLDPESYRASLAIEGAPVGALVLVDGTRVGRLPRVDVVGLAPGPHRVEVRAPNHRPLTERTTLEAGKTQRLRMELSLVEVTVLDGGASDTAIAGWTSLGVGLVFVGVGGGLVGRAFALQDDLRGLNGQAEAGGLSAASYYAQYDETKGEQDIVYPSGIASLSVGGSLLITSIVLLVLDSADDETDRSPVATDGR